MCGIFGLWLNRALTDTDIAIGHKGTNALSHRGPDNQGTWFQAKQGLFLGHTRLSIIDVSQNSHQPMRQNDTVLTYNGEIYNYQELAHQLKTNNIVQSTTGDTEILLQSWMHWGAQCLDKFDGMFAFALYDGHQLHLAVDPFGEKPLYWAETSDGVYFASEPGPLVDLLNLKPDFSTEHIASFLSLGFVPSPHTGYQGLYRLRPGSHQIWSTPQTKTHHIYWHPSEPVSHKGKVQPLSESALDDITDTLTASLMVRLRADVPLGLFLSSGIDSLIVAALAKKELKHDIHAYTVKFPDTDVADESPTAAQAAQFLGLQHTIIDSANDPARTDPNVIFDLFGEANDNITIAAAYQMSLAATNTLKVALTGVGGDEMFYGYNKYDLLYRWRRWLTCPQSLRNGLASNYPSFFPKRWRTLITLLSASDPQRFLASKNVAIFHWLKKVPEFATTSEKYFTSIQAPIELIGRHFDLTHTLPDTFIPAIERGSMRASLEVRTPFLSRNLYNTLAKYDQRAFIAFGSKSVLRRILKRYLPETITNLPKQGFNYPPSAFLAHVTSQPDIPTIPQTLLKEAWANNDNQAWQTLLIRLVILDHFSNGKTHANTKTKIQYQPTSC
jgi:asparagine synthase (glutamine-hydrolysing)